MYWKRGNFGNTFKNNRTINNIVLILLSFCAACGLNFYVIVCYQTNKDILLQSGYRALLKCIWEQQRMTLILHILISVVLFWCIFRCFWFNYGRICDYLYRYRYLVAVAVLITGTFLELNGSSIAVWENYIGTGDSGNGLIFGMPRGIRSDDVFVWTPIAFSQYYNGSGAFGYFSDTVRGMHTDVSILYGVPSISIATLFRPMYWGYLILKPAQGYSFMWIFRQLALLLGTFELGMILTKKDKLLSFIAAVLVAYSPLVQWWFNTAQQADVVTFGQIIIVCFYYYFMKEKLWQKILLAAGLFISMGGYVLIFYPAGQIPVFFVVAMMIIGLLITDRYQISFVWRKDVPIILVTIILFLGCMGYIIYLSRDTIATVINTAYPGARVTTGGGLGQALFRYPIEVWETMNCIDNNINVAMYDFFPLGIVLSLFLLVRERSKDLVIILLLLLQLFMTEYLCRGLSPLLAKLTLMNYSTSIAVMWAIGLINIYLLFRAVAMSRRAWKWWQSGILAMMVSIYVMVNCWKYYKDLSISKLFAVLAGVLLAVTMYCIIMSARKYYKKLLALLCTIIALFSGVLVNPVQQGMDEIYEHSLVQNIREICEDDDGLWLVEGSFPVTNLPLFAGAPTINSTNTYPAIERWSMLDPSGVNRDIYNRYAHIHVELVDGATTFELTSADAFRVYLNKQDLRKLNVKYILTGKQYDDFIGDIRIQLVGRSSGYNIYKLVD